ncbi:MAG: STAS-like domain-containing protein [Lachnospiraceae bacterium]|nr:STAS-like domain-containing protein [Lachnospiraceae bacterium]
MVEYITIIVSLELFMVIWMRERNLVIIQSESELINDIKKITDKNSTVDGELIKTRLPILEACQGNEPVARSQARRICIRLDNFKEAILDFDGVEMMGQGFADEIFRVFHNAHPEVVLTPINMNDFVNNMYLYTIHNKVMTYPEA